MTDTEIVQAAIEILERCKIPGSPGRIDEEIAELLSDTPDVAHAARIVGVTR